MVFSNISEIENLDLEAIEKEIILVAQELVNLRVKKATRQEFKPHQFKHNKRKLAQLLTIQNTKLANATN
jgi:large subunit ribosomal protein L29|tara:strand:- start:11254 stop:11463 length:210 start_codon:yes stop_codon:yes gene_type:complete